YGNALSFNGTCDWVNVIESNTLDLTNGMTRETWVKPSNLTGWKSVITKENGTNDLVYSLSANNNSSGRRRTRGSRGRTASRPVARIRIGSTTRTVTGTAKLPLNTWTHLASTYDGTSLRLYVNGTQ